MPLRGLCLVGYFTLMRPKNNKALTWEELTIDPVSRSGWFKLADHKNKRKGITARGALHPKLLDYLLRIRPANASGLVHPNPVTGFAYVDILLEFAPPHSIAERLKTKWKPELKELGKAFPDLLEQKTSRWRLFWHTSTNTLGRNQKSTKEFARQLWKDPDRAPAYRLDLEITYETLDTTNPKWKDNDFLDLVHAGALPYVDLFVTQDGPLLGKLAWYDENVRTPVGKDPYMPKVCASWVEFLAKSV